MYNVGKLAWDGLFFFFFSSRRRHTRYWRDWSSDVCSSDLQPAPARAAGTAGARPGAPGAAGTRPQRTAHRGDGGQGLADGDLPGPARQRARQVGSGSGRERVEMSVGAVSLTKQKKATSSRP